VVESAVKGVAMASDYSEPIERWTTKRRAALVISILKDETTAAEAAPKVDAGRKRATARDTSLLTRLDALVEPTEPGDSE
jgi:hypothetical protein